MIIRPFSENDAQEISRLISTCLTEVISKEYDERAIGCVREEYTPEGIVEKANKSVMIVAEAGDRVVGTARLEGDTIFTVYVDPAMHRNRIGSKLMDEVEAFARRQGHIAVRVEAFTSSKGFYARRGYEKVRVIGIEGFGTIVEMRKAL